MTAAKSESFEIVSARGRRSEGGLAPHLDSQLARIRRGYYIDAQAVVAAVEAHRLRIRATAEARLGPLVFSHTSAAVLWGCPMMREDLGYVHLTQPGRARRTTAGAKVHRSELADEHVAELDCGLTVTSREWTAVNVAASGSLPGVLLPLDFLLGDIAADRSISTTEARDLVVELVPHGIKGRSKAIKLIQVADGLSGSAGESLSRGQMIRLGVPAPQLQVAIPHADRRGSDILDFDWPELGVFGEFDGKAKYVDEAFTGGRTPEEVLWAEKAREDRIRRVRPRGARWGWADALSPVRLAAILDGVGVRPTRKVSP